MTNSYIDLMIRLKNSSMAKKDSVIVLYSKININIVKKLKELKFIEDYLIEKDAKKINLILKYENNISVITDIKILSKPGKRIYFKKNDLSSLKRIMSVFLISTPKGIMTSKEAIKKNMGGELLFEIW